MPRCFLYQIAPCHQQAAAQNFHIRDSPSAGIRRPLKRFTLPDTPPTRYHRQCEGGSIASVPVQIHFACPVRMRAAHNGYCGVKSDVLHQARKASSGCHRHFANRLMLISTSLLRHQRTVRAPSDPRRDTATPGGTF